MPPVELPDVLVVLLGALSPLLVQFIKKGIKERIIRFFIAFVLTGGTGAAAFYIVHPVGLDLPDSIAWAFAASQLTYQFFKSLWQE